MTQEQINEGNKLIVEFMEVKYVWDPKTNSWVSTTNDNYTIANILKYHSSWDWLMPVVEKIESMGFWFNIKKNHVSVCFDNKGTFDSKLIVSEFGDQTKIERVYNCIIYTIKYISYKKGVE